MPPTDVAWFVLAERLNPNGRGRYGRVSMNRDKLSKSVANQLGEGGSYFEAQGWPENEDLIFSDDNISASEYTTKDRPGFIELQEAIRTRRMWHLTVTEPSRITRVVGAAVDFVRLAKEAGGLIVETTEGKRFDLMTVTGEYDFYDAISGAGRESGTKSDRIKRNKRNVALDGRYHGGRPRYGRVRAEKDKFGRVLNTGAAGHDLIDEEATVAAKVIQRIADGDHLLTIVRDLTKDGVVGVSGVPFTTSVLRKTISSPHMYGAATYKGRVVKEDAFPPIVDKALWDEAMIRLSAADRMKGNERKGWGTYLLTNRVGCMCGNQMTAHARNDGKGSERAYLCRLYDNAGERVGCGKRRLAEPVELMVADYMKAKFNSDAFREALRRALQQDGDNDELGVVLKQVSELEAKLNELEDAYLAGGEGFDLKQLGRMQTGVQNQLKEATAKADRMLARKGLSVAFNGNFNEVWELADRNQRRQFMDLIGVRVTIHPRDPKAPRGKWTHEGTGKTWVFNPDLVAITSQF